MFMENNLKRKIIPLFLLFNDEEAASYGYY